MGPACNYPAIGFDVLTVARAWRAHQQRYGLKTRSGYMFALLQRAADALPEAKASLPLLSPSTLVTAVTTGTL